ncbi:MAG: hypothetical protein LBL67_03370 [Coriobacteriales bacterium]|jgi:hypothetical protein|nr:hypothetical protein [Coriobacteriales bacterium]
MSPSLRRRRRLNWVLRILALLLTLALAGFATGIIPLALPATYDDGNGEVFSGMVEDGHFSGPVTVRFSDGSSYVGALKDMRFDGYGTYIFPDGHRLSGYFSGGQFVQP